MGRIRKSWRNGVLSIDIMGLSLMEIIAGFFIALFIAVTVGPYLQEFAESILGLGYAAEARHSAQAMSYALSCTSLIHSSVNCDGTWGQSSWQHEACTEMEESWNKDAIPASNKVNKPCSAAVNSAAAFGEVEVRCDSFDAGDSGKCEIRGFTLPQRFAAKKGENVIQVAKQYLMGYGTPKYLLAYEGMDQSFAQDWETRLTKQSLMVLLGSAAMSGLIAGFAAGGTLVAARRVGGGGSAFRTMMDRIPRGMLRNGFDTALDAVKDTLPASVLGRRVTTGPSGARVTLREAIEELRGWLGYKLGAWKARLPTPPSIVKKAFFRTGRVWTDEAGEPAFRMHSRFHLMDQLDILEGSAGRDAFGDVMEFMWEGTTSQPGLRQLYVEGVDDYGLNGRTIREAMEDGDDAAVRDALSDRYETLFRQFGDVDDVPVPTPPGPARQADNLADDSIDSMRAAIAGEDFAVEHGMSKQMYWAMSAHQSSQAQAVMEAIEEGNDELAQRHLRNLLGDGRKALDELPDDARPRIMAQAESSLCGSRVTAKFAAYFVATDMATEMDLEGNEEYAATVAPAATQAAGKSVTEAVGTACSRGKSPLNAIVNARNGGTLAASAAAWFLMSNGRQFSSQIIKQPWGSNNLVLSRPSPFLEPIRYPLNNYTHWWFVNLEQGQEIGVGGHDVINPPGRRLQLASPCYPVPNDDSKPAKVVIQRDKIDALMEPSCEGMLCVIEGVGDRGLKGPQWNRCYWDSGYGQGQSVTWAKNRELRSEDPDIVCMWTQNHIGTADTCFQEVDSCEDHEEYQYTNYQNRQTPMNFLCHQNVDSCTSGNCMRFFKNDRNELNWETVAECSGLECFKDVQECTSSMDNCVVQKRADTQRPTEACQDQDTCFKLVEEESTSGRCRGAVSTCEPLNQDQCEAIGGCEYDSGECTKKSGFEYPVSCRAISQENVCNNIEGAAGGAQQLEDQGWGASVRGSYSAWWGVDAPVIGRHELEKWIMYTRSPLVWPVPEKGMRPNPPGMFGDFRSNVFVHQVSDPAYGPESDSAYPDGTRPHFDQRGVWKECPDDSDRGICDSGESGDWYRDVPHPRLTAYGNAKKYVKRKGLLTWASEWQPFEKIAEYEVDALTVEWKNTDFDRTEVGPNYCYGKVDHLANVAQASIFGLAISLEIVLDAVDFVSVGSTYLATGAAEFVIGTSEYLLAFWVGEAFGKHWPY